MRLRRLSLSVLRLLLWASTLALVLVAAAVLSERGTALLVLLIDASVPGLTLEHRSGSLLEAHFTRIAWHGDAIDVSAEELEWTLAPRCLLSDRLCIDSLALSRLVIELAENTEESAPLDLDPLLAPMPVTITQGSIGSLEIHREGSEAIMLHDIHLAGSYTDSRIALTRLDARMDQYSGTFVAEVDLRKQLPLRLEGHIDWPPRLRLELLLDGDLARLGFKASSSGEYAFDADGFAELLAEAPAIELVARSRESVHPLADDPEAARFDAIELQVSGSSEQLQIDFTARLDGRFSGAGKMEGKANWSPEALRLEQLDFTGDAGRLTASAQLRDSHWQALVQTEDFCPLAWEPRFACRLSGTAELEGDIDAGDSSLAANIALSGTINEHEARIEGRAARHPDAGWQLTGMRILSGSNQLRLAGHIGTTLALDASLELRALGDTLAGASGSGRATVQLGGTPDDPRIVGQLSAHGLHWLEQAADDIRLELRWLGRDQDRNRIHLEASGLQAAGIPVEQLEFTFAGPLGAHRLGLDAAAAGTHLATACAGALRDNGDWRGSCDALNLSLHATQNAWQLDRVLQLAWNAGDETLRVGAFCLQQTGAALCSERTATLAADRLDDIVLDGKDIPLAVFAPWLPAELQGEGLLGFKASVNRAAGKAPHIAAQASGAAIRLGIPVAGDSLALEVNGFTARLLGNDEGIVLDWQLGLRGGGAFDGKLGVGANGRKLDGTLRLDGIELSRFAPLFPDLLEMQGTLAGELQLQGTPRAPQASGSLQLTGGRFVHERLPDAIEEASTSIDFDGNEAHIVGHFDTGSGSTSLDGKAFFAAADGWHVDLGLHSAGLQIEPLRGSRATIAPELRLQLGPTHAQLSGEVYLPSADIRIDTLPDTAVSESPYAVIVGEEKDASPFSYGIDVQVRLGKKVRLRGMGADARLEGAVDITRNADDGLLRGRGEIRVVEGSFKAYGQDLEISDGRIRFRGALDRPELDLSAIRHIEDEGVQVGVRVRGRPGEPAVSVFSRPAMEESLAMYYLLTGHKPEADGNTDLAVSSMLLQLGTAGANRIAGSTLGRLGIQDVQLGARQVDGGTEVQLSAYLSPDLYLRYGVSTFDRINTIRLRYRLHGAFYVEAISGVETAIDFLYSFER